MNRDQFLEHSDEFIGWMAARLDRSGTFEHRWTSGADATGVPAGQQWSCSSLYEAYENYVWHADCNYMAADGRVRRRVVRTFRDTHRYLDGIRKRLLASIADDDAVWCRRHCLDVLRLGGVMIWGNVATEIRDPNVLGNLLPRYLKAARDFLQRQALDTRDRFEFSADGVHWPPSGHAGPGPSVDAGSTKVFSLICPDFLMYHGRVGAALGLLVRRWVEQTRDGDFGRLPEHLRFAWGGHSRGATRRNPNPDGKNIFPRLRTVPRSLHNIHANWLCRAVVDRAAGRFADLDTHGRFRALEAALFMIGYDLSQSLAESPALRLIA